MVFRTGSAPTVAVPCQKISPGDSALISALGCQASALIKARGGMSAWTLLGRSRKNSSEKNLLQRKRRCCQRKSEEEEEGGLQGLPLGMVRCGHSRDSDSSGDSGVHGAGAAAG